DSRSDRVDQLCGSRYDRGEATLSDIPADTLKGFVHFRAAVAIQFEPDCACRDLPSDAVPSPLNGHRVAYSAARRLDRAHGARQGCIATCANQDRRLVQIVELISLDLSVVHVDLAL